MLSPHTPLVAAVDTPPSAEALLFASPDPELGGSLTSLPGSSVFTPPGSSTAEVFKSWNAETTPEKVAIELD